jgi:hypothetical protein
MPRKNWNPDSFDDRSLPKNSLSKERELEIDLMMCRQLPKAIKKLKGELSEQKSFTSPVNKKK